MNENKKKTVVLALSVLFAMTFLSANSLGLSGSAKLSDTSSTISAGQSDGRVNPDSDAGDQI